MIEGFIGVLATLGVWSIRPRFLLFDTGDWTTSAKWLRAHAFQASLSDPESHAIPILSNLTEFPRVNAEENTYKL